MAGIQYNKSEMPFYGIGAFYFHFFHFLFNIMHDAAERDPGSSGIPFCVATFLQFGVVIQL